MVAYDISDEFLAMHFANMVWKFTTCEIMEHAGTDQQVFDAAVKFAEEIGVDPIRVHKGRLGTTTGQDFYNYG